MSFYPSGKVLVASHDAGGAEVVSSWVRRHPENSYQFLLEGPAIGVFNRKRGMLENYPRADLERLLLACDFVLTGTSWPADLEKTVIAVARSRGVPTASFLDHWVNYSQRFQIGDQTILPDQLWVGDEHALDLARQQFPSQTVQLVPNPYFEDIRGELIRLESTRRNSDELRILYVTEPVANGAEQRGNNADQEGYTEFEALAAFFDQLQVLDLPKPLGSIRIRQHPAEPPNKYRGVLDLFSHLPLATSEGTSLAEDCVWADWVVGCETTALVVGLLCGRAIYCTIPDPTVCCRLPHPEIQRLSRPVGSPVCA